MTTTFKLLSLRANMAMRLVEIGQEAGATSTTKACLRKDACKQLEKLGYIAFRANPADPKDDLVVLTPLGVEYRAWLPADA